VSVSLSRLAELPVVKAADSSTVLRTAADKAEAGIRGAMATILAKRGSAPGTPGQKLYVAADGTACGTVGGGAVEREVLLALLEMLEADEPEHAVRSFKLGPELGMCCGGGVEVLLEPIARLIPLIIVGGGHVATAVAPLLARLGFAVTVADAREGWGSEGRIPGVRCVQDEYSAAASNLPLTGVFLVMTHDHMLDQEAIEWALKRGFAYVGGVGSRAKAKRTRDRLAAKGFSAEDIGRVVMPIGLAVGARLPEEIAVAIAAEMVAWKRGKSVTQKP
jgi:xanthine dehydrogenase accessory factor